ncbi:hypothetical protein Aduo_004619 [Ancylostoma duodenale]
MPDSNQTENFYDWPYRQAFFIFNIIAGFLFVIMHSQMISVILQTRSLRSMAGYRFMVHISAVDLVNCITQIVAQICTLNTPYMNPIVNEINGAIFQGTWAADYPMTLIIALNRVVAVMLPFKVRILFGDNLTYFYIAACLVFGGMNTAACLSGELACVWIAEIPSFAFTTHSVFKDIAELVDFWFAEVIILCSTACYIAILVYLLQKRKLLTSSRHELPLLFHFCCIFGITGISLFFWHHPAANNALYYEILQTVIVFRFGMPPLAALLVNGSIRSRFFQLRQGKSMLMSSTGVHLTKTKGTVRISTLTAAHTVLPHSDRPVI